MPGMPQNMGMPPGPGMGMPLPQSMGMPPGPGNPFGPSAMQPGMFGGMGGPHMFPGGSMMPLPFMGFPPGMPWVRTRVCVRVCVCVCVCVYVYVRCWTFSVVYAAEC
jgi:hypothetical protein